VCAALASPFFFKKICIIVFANYAAKCPLTAIVIGKVGMGKGRYIMPSPPPSLLFFPSLHHSITFLLRETKIVTGTD
jgi:hypothetical protein